MAARVAEEEQTQRTMISLNDLKPFYPGRVADEVTMVLDRVSRIMRIQGCVRKMEKEN